MLLLKQMYWFYFMYECSACTCVLGACKGQQKESGPRELELQRVVSYHTVLGTKPWASATAVLLTVGLSLVP